MEPKLTLIFFLLAGASQCFGQNCHKSAESLFVSWVGSTCVTVYWMPPGSTIKEVEFFTLFYKRVGDELYSEPKVVKGLSTKLDGLAARTEYELKLVAFPKNHEGFEPISIKFTTAKDDTTLSCDDQRPPHNLNAFRMTSSDWMIRWDAPTSDTDWTYTMFVGKDRDERQTTPVTVNHYRLWAGPTVGWRFIRMEATQGEKVHHAWFAIYVSPLCNLDDEILKSLGVPRYRWHRYIDYMQSWRPQDIFEVSDIKTTSSSVHYERPPLPLGEYDGKFNTFYYGATDSLSFTVKNTSDVDIPLEHLKAGAQHVVIVERPCFSALKSSALFFNTASQ